MLNKFRFQIFYAVDDAGGSKPLSADGILDLLNAEDDNEEDEIDLSGDKPTKSVKKETSKDEKTEEDKGKRTKDDGEKDVDDENEDEEDEDELDEIEKELEGDEADEEELELVTPVRRKEILKKYPDVFKDFPYLERAYYREQKYTEIFPNIDDAKTALEDQKVLQEFEKNILNGDLSGIVEELKKEDQNAYHKLIDNYLPTLQKIDEKAFFHVVSSIIKPVIRNMVEEGQRSKDEEMVSAARVLNQYIYNSSKWEPHQPLAKPQNDEISAEQKKVQDERKALFEERFTEARTKLNTRVEGAFKKAIDSNIDPKDEMSAYVKKTASREAFEMLSTLMQKDTRFRALIDRGWKKAGESNFSEESMDTIRRMINARAKTVLPSVIKKARIEALRGIGKRVRNVKDDDNDFDTEDNDKSGRSTSSRNRGPLKQSSDKSGNRSGGGKQTEIPKGMSNKDYIMAD